MSPRRAEKNPPSKSRSKPTRRTEAVSVGERLHKVLARAGVASRRAAERLIEEGRVRVNGEVVRDQGVRIDPERDAVRVDESRVTTRGLTPRNYLMLHKPRGVVTTMRDPEGRKSVSDLVRGAGGRVFPVGRLDYASEGLLLLTDDGALAQSLSHPSSAVGKTYSVKVSGSPSEETLARLAGGVILDGRRTLPARIRRESRGATSWLEVTLFEGRNRQVRRMFEGAGHRVLRLKRVAYGALRLGGLAPGRWRRLSDEELRRLREEAASAKSQRRTGRRPL